MIITSDENVLNLLEEQEIEFDLFKFKTSLIQILQNSKISFFFSVDNALKKSHYI